MKFPFLVYFAGQFLIFLLIIESNKQIVSESALITHSVLSSVLILLFLILCYKNPGYILVNRNIQAQEKIKQSLTQISIFNQQKTNHLNQQAISHQSQQSHQNQQNQKILCQICNLQKTLRSFHCQKCQKCIPTYDHHCLFIGKCIGQKNRHIFYVFCSLQLYQSLYLMVQIIREIILTGQRSKQSLMIVCFCLIISFLMGTLWIFQTLFMIFNLTMQQLLIANSPIFQVIKNNSFSKGILVNIYQFWKGGLRKQLMNWQVNNQ